MSARRLTQLVALAALVAVVLAVGFSTWQDWEYQRRELALSAEVDAHALGPENPPSPASFFPAVAVEPQPKTTFEVLTARDARNVVADEETVLGVEINGETRAYPINMMAGPTREVFNDELGGRMIAATW